MGKAANLERAGPEGFVLGAVRIVASGNTGDSLFGKRRLYIAANTDVGLLYGTFALIRQLQSGRRSPRSTS